MIQYAEVARSLVSERTRDDLDRDIALNLALERAIEIVGGAASHISPEGRREIGLPWPKIIGMRHRLVHAYVLVDQNILWRTATVELPAVVAVLRRALDTA